MRHFYLFIFVLMLGGMPGARASQSIPDQYPQSLLYSKPVEVIPGVFSAIGATAPPGYDNSGHNNNLSFIVTGDGVIVINGSASYLLAKALYDEIKKVTDQPVKLVINENGQGHAMLGNSYWIQFGIPILAHVDAAAEFEKSGYDSLDRMKRFNKEKAEGTFVQGPTETMTDKKISKLIEDGGGLQEAYEIDQSPYSKLDTFKELAKRNAGRVFEQVEFE